MICLLSPHQVKVNEEDEGWIYGIYTCRSTNTMGFADWPIELKRASKCKHSHVFVASV